MRLKIYFSAFQNMLRIRKILLTLSLVIGVGTLGSSLAYAWYLHSDIYRQSLRRRVGEYLGLPVEIGRVRPLTLRSKSLQDIKVYLPGRRVQIFECAAALWKEQPREGESVFELELKGGALIIGADRWNRPDYRRVFESGFAHDFSDLNLKRVWLSDMDVRVIRKGWTLQIDDAGF